MKVRVLFLIILCISSVIVNSIDKSKTIDNILEQFKYKEDKEIFKVWHFLFEKKYDINTEEAITRFKAFKENLKYIKQVNAQNLSYKLGLNQFSDKTATEFEAENSLSPKPCEETRKKGFFDEDSDDLTAETKQINSPLAAIDWRNQFNPPRDMTTIGACKDSIAFSLSGSMEGNYSILKKKVIPYLSAKQLVDCNVDNSFNSWGCSSPRFTYYIDLQYFAPLALNNDSDYPYQVVAPEGCKYQKSKPTTTVKTWQYCSDCESNNNCTFQIAYNILTLGPFSAYIYIATQQFQSYKSGILNVHCDGMSGTFQVVVVVGYGIDATTGVDYFIVRNSWGTTWGESGYFRIQHSDNNVNTCWLTSYAYLPKF